MQNLRVHCIESVDHASLARLCIDLAEVCWTPTRDWQIFQAGGLGQVVCVFAQVSPGLSFDEMLIIIVFADKVTLNLPFAQVEET